MKTKGRKSKADSPELSGSMGAYGAEGDDLPTKPLETRRRAVGSIPTLSTLSPTKAKVYAFLRSYFKEHDRLPCTREIAEFRGVCQTMAVNDLRALERGGFLEKDGAKWRFARKEKV